MYCSDQRAIAFNVLSFSFEMVYTVLETILKCLHICAFDFSRLSTALITDTLVSIVMHFVLLVVFVDTFAMQWGLTMRVKKKI